MTKRPETFHTEETTTNIMHITVLATVFSVFIFVLFILYRLSSNIGEKLIFVSNIIIAATIVSFIAIFSYLIIYWKKGSKRHTFSLRKHKQRYSSFWGKRS